MIQRIQSIFLVLAAAAFGGLWVYPFATTQASVADHLFSDGRYAIDDHVLLMSLTIAGILLSVIALFLFKNRRSQMRIGYLLIVIGILVPVVAYLYFTSQAATIGTSEINDAPGMFLPFAGALFAALANYFIRKDEKLVRSMDRLR